MKKIAVSNLKPNMRLAKTIINKEGLVLLYEGIRLTETYIRSLKKLGIQMVYVHEQEIKSKQLPEVMSKHIQKKAFQELWSYIDLIINRKMTKTMRIKNRVEGLVNQVFGDPFLFYHMMDLFFFDDYTFNHSLHVSFLSILLGVELDLPEKDLLQLGKGAFLHDIGKMKIPLEILNKPGELTSQEFEEIKRHSILGHQMIKQYQVLSKEASSILLHHHERINGEGYPYHLKDQEIHLFNRIVALADVFDAMSSHKPYKKGKDLYTTVMSIKKMEEFSKDPLLFSFLTHIAVYPVGTMVILNNQYQGLVVDGNKKEPKKPLVKLMKNHRGEPIKEDLLIDLQNGNLFIKDLKEKDKPLIIHRV